ncbi:MAG: hypothetical protein GY884_34590 [Proteobacteria bacterium]|nr:hypothetical protein [Pseudomonadota bacterium]
MIWLWMLACTAPPDLVEADSTAVSAQPDDSGPVSTGLPVDTATTSDGTTPVGDGYHGALLDPPLDPAVFVVENQDGEARSEAWLLGAPTVLWFYRDAGTAG